MTSAALVWVAPERPDVSEARVIAAWGQANGLALAPPADEHPAALPVDERSAPSVDDLIESARDAVTEGDGSAADQAVATAEEILQSHPELPNAAWLMAEVERARSARLRLLAPVDGNAADRAWRRAAALDGGRIAGIGEESAADSPRGATLALSPPAGEQAWLDGIPVAAGTVTSREGLHAVMVSWKGSPIWAAWIDAPSGSSAVPLPAPVVPPCSAWDLGAVRVREGGVVSASDVRCARWVAATTGLFPNAVRFASCESNRCGPLLDWQPAPAWMWSPEKGSARRSWPPWATWGLVGAGVAAAAAIAVAIAARSQVARPETRFVSGGLRSP